MFFKEVPAGAWEPYTGTLVELRYSSGPVTVVKLSVFTVTFSAIQIKFLIFLLLSPIELQL